MNPVEEFYYGNMPHSRVNCGYQYHTNAVAVVEFSVPQCCTTGCESEIKDRLYKVRGVRRVIVDYPNQKVTVSGYFAHDELGGAIQWVKNDAEMHTRERYNQRPRWT